MCGYCNNKDDNHSITTFRGTGQSLASILLLDERLVKFLGFLAECMREHNNSRWNMTFKKTFQASKREGVDSSTMYEDPFKDELSCTCPSYLSLQ